MNRRTKQVGIVAALVAMILFGTWPFWKKLYIKTASPALQSRTEALVASHPELKSMYDAAMEDEELTFAEAKEIVERAGEKVEAEE